MKATKETILQFLKEHKEELQYRYKIEKIGLFGSYVRGEETEQSDIDIVVSMPSNFDLYYELKEHLEDSFNKKIDLGLEKNIRKVVKEYIDKEVIYA